MNYQKIYNSLILNRQNNPLPKETYSEKHHIIPKSHGGSNEESNLVRLSAREHFIAHWLLWRIHRDKSMAFAFNSMRTNKDGQVYRNSFGFEEARKALSKSMQGNSYGLGYVCTKEQRINMSNAKKSVRLSKETRLKISISHKGKTISDEAKKNMSNAQKGKVLSAETRYKIAMSRRGTKQPTIICPHCNKEGGISPMTRWHFNNCNNRV